MKPIRLIELFSGVGAQASALERLGVPFEHWITSDWEVNAVASYNAIHIGDYTDYSEGMDEEALNAYLWKMGISTDGKKPMKPEQIARKGIAWKRTVYNNFVATNNLGSVTQIHGVDLEIEQTDKYTYLLTYLFVPVSRFISCRKAKGNGERQRHTVRDVVGG